ncbi:MAG: hypothetical protein ACXVDZ_17050 [Bacteroidia bacterium]
MRSLILLFLFCSLNCLSQDRNNSINTDTILINTHLADTTVFKLHTLKSEKGLSVWFSFVNDSGRELFIDRISTGDGGTEALYKGEIFRRQKIKTNDTLTFCVYFEPPLQKSVYSRGIQIVGIDPKDQAYKPLVRFELMLYVKE